MLTEPLGQTRSKSGTLHIHSIRVLPIDLLNEKNIRERHISTAGPPVQWWQTVCIIRAKVSGQVVITISADLPPRLWCVWEGNWRGWEAGRSRPWPEKVDRTGHAGVDRLTPLYNPRARLCFYLSTTPYTQHHGQQGV